MADPRVAVIQFRPRKADYTDNLRRIGAMFAQLAGLEEVPNIVVFPESATSGYFLEGGVREVAVPAGVLYRDLQMQHAESGCPPLDVVIGFYEEFQNHVHNSALYASLGGDDAGIQHVHRKVFLPTYGVFDERRFVHPGRSVQAFDTRWGRAGIVVCEDAWHSITPTLAALDGAKFLFIPSASPARGVVPARVQAKGEDDQTLPASLERWERLARTIAGEHGIYVVMAQLVGFEGGKGFPGGSVITGPDGDVVARGPLFEEALLVAELSDSTVTRVRADQPLLSDLRVEMANLLESFYAEDQEPAAYDDGVERVSTGGADPSSIPIVLGGDAADPLAVDPELLERWLIAFLQEEVVARRGFEKGVVGLSGGVDSSLTAFLAARALGKENVIGVRMPYASSSVESLEHANMVAEMLGIEMETVDITAAVDGYAKAVGSKPDPTRLGNVMARMRMITLFDLSAARKALPLGTGNKTERLLGYFTWHADDSPPVNPLGDLFKTQVWALAQHVGIPEEIVTKPATADLVVGQTDESDLGISYTRADMILAHLLRGFSPEEIAASGFSAEEIGLVRKRLDSTHWKRRLPTVAMVSQTAIGEYYLRPVDY
jgi:NAD+ synthetase